MSVLTPLDDRLRPGEFFTSARASHCAAGKKKKKAPPATSASTLLDPNDPEEALMIQHNIERAQAVQMRIADLEKQLRNYGITTCSRIKVDRELVALVSVTLRVIFA